MLEVESALVDLPLKIKFNKTEQEIERTEEEVPLIQVCYDEDTPINFGCRIGMCGTCMIKITDGIENVSEKNQAEEDMMLEEDERLGCQCIIKGDVEIE